MSFVEQTSRSSLGCRGVIYPSTVTGLNSQCTGNERSHLNKLTPGRLDRDSDFAGPGRGYGYIGRRDLIRSTLEELIGYVLDGRIELQVGAVFPLARASERIAFSKVARPRARSSFSQGSKTADRSRFGACAEANAVDTGVGKPFKASDAFPHGTSSWWPRIASR